MKVCKEDEKIANTGESSFKRMAGNASVRKALLIGVMLQLFQQLAGINTGQMVTDSPHVFILLCLQ